LSTYKREVTERGIKIARLLVDLEDEVRELYELINYGPDLTTPEEETALRKLGTTKTLLDILMETFEESGYVTAKDLFLITD
jgi:hypothetical protein